MDGSPDDERERTAVERVDRRQLLLIAFCLAAVVVAAVLAPPSVRSDVPTPAGEGSVESTPRPSGAGGGSGGTGENDDPVPIPGGSAPPTDGCGVLLEDEPVPGSNVTVGVFEDSAPRSGVQVQFNGEPVGLTNATGRVTGRVPYNHTLSVTVDARTDCEFYREQFRSGDQAQANVRPNGDPARALSRSRAPVRSAVSGVTGVLAGVRQSGNDTGEYAVRGEVNVTVRGEPYPGSEVTLVARIDGVPMRRATVAVDGSMVGRTDGSGLGRLTVPDGRQEVPVTVRRGDFAGEATVDVLLLTVTVQPREGVPVPGERAVVNASLDGDPIGDLPVRVGGRRVGSTAPDGTLEIGLPAAPAATVVASTDRQTATVPVWMVYVPTLVNLFAVFWLGVTGIGAAHLLGNGRTTERVAVAWSGFAVADVALVVGEQLGLGLAFSGMGVVGLVRYRRRVRSGGERAAGTVARLVTVVRRVALEITVTIERLLDRSRRLLGRLWAGLTSFETLAAWVGAVVRKVVATVRAYLTLRRAGIALFAFAELAVATVRWGDEGFLASVSGLSLLAVLVALWRRDDADTPVATEDGRTPGGDRHQRVTRDDESGKRVLSVRELWRRFAKRVVPGAWRTRTPGEVARAAVDRGFPREPVEALTDAFRDVEYGNEPATTRRERAKAAFDRLARTRGEDDE